MEEHKYSDHATQQEKAFEAICKRCGECCGALDNPCRNLRKQADGKYVCAEYESRLGSQKTMSGFIFKCVSIREHIKNDTLRPGCAYRNIRSNCL